MTTAEDRTTQPVDQADLAALREAIGDVLDLQAGRRQLHEHVDGKTRLDRSLWGTAAELGWLGLGLPEASGGLAVASSSLEPSRDEPGSLCVMGGRAN